MWSRFSTWSGVCVCACVFRRYSVNGAFILQISTHLTSSDLFLADLILSELSACEATQFAAAASSATSQNRRPVFAISQGSSLH